VRRECEPAAKLNRITDRPAEGQLPRAKSCRRSAAGRSIFGDRGNTHLDEPGEIVDILGLIRRRPPVNRDHRTSILRFPRNSKRENPVASYNTGEFRKGLKVQIDGEPYVMTHCEFVKPGKGNALYKCKLRNLIKNSMLDRTYRGGDSLEAADVSEIQAQYLYRQADTFYFMDNSTYEQYELSKEQVDDAWQWLKEGMVCSMTLYNNRPIAMAAPFHVVLKVDFCEPAVRGNTATNVTKPVRLETGAEIQCPSFVDMGDLIRVDTRTGEYLERVKE